MNTAEKIKIQAKNAAEAMEMAEDETDGYDLVDQDWDNGSTTWTFGDGSRLTISGEDVWIDGELSTVARARKGGSAKSAAKVAAARRNGAKGGRPKNLVAKKLVYTNEQRDGYGADEDDAPRYLVDAYEFETGLVLVPNFVRPDDFWVNRDAYQPNGMDVCVHVHETGTKTTFTERDVLEAINSFAREYGPEQFRGDWGRALGDLGVNETRLALAVKGRL